MRSIGAELQAHLATGATSLCRCWKVTRKDGTVFGFTDHDRVLAFDGVTFKAGTGLDGAALQQSTGLNVDNTQAVGALSDLALREADILAGLYDGAEVLAWLANWTDVAQRVLQFRGSLGEVRRAGGAFEAELRGLTEVLNQPQGRAYHRNCSAVLGDDRCNFDLNTAGYTSEVSVEVVEEARVFRFANLTGFDERWFEAGSCRVLDGEAVGAIEVIKSDVFTDGIRVIELWQSLRREIAVGDLVRFEAGCDKRVATCGLKFQNFINFRGFPHIPGEDWAVSFPTKAGVNDGESRYT